MKQYMKTSAIRSVWVGLMTGLVILCLSAINHKKSAVITGVEVNVDGFEHGDVFLTEDDVRAEILSLLDTTDNQLISTVDVTKLEELLYGNPFVRNAEVFISSDGMLSVTIEQREPLVRVFTDSEMTYYIDRNGLHMPVSPYFTARVVVVTGEIDALGHESVLDHPQLAGAYHLARQIEGDKFLKSLIEQVHLTRDGEISLIPKLGTTVIAFGNAENIALKLETLKSFYTQVVKENGWDQYANINLAYDGQIVCKRKES
jgi:cell division protein FtsQ